MIESWHMDRHRIVCPDHYVKLFKDKDLQRPREKRMPVFDHEWEGGNCYYCLRGSVVAAQI